MKIDSEGEFFQATGMEGVEEASAEVKGEAITGSSLRCMEEIDEATEDLGHSNLNTSLGLGPKGDDTGGQSGGGSDSKENAGAIPYRPRHRKQSMSRAQPETSETITDSRSSRPSADAKAAAKNQLLPRYWPRITDQEIQQINSGDSKSVITPLFEKILSASDAGRIGRLVLPKACAEAYFPPISHAEGLPLKISDINGREWQFQFRFWPNNNSRMYVLEGVTPCIQAMRLQAGDTVTFSRLEPDDKLIMGYRKAHDTGDGDYRSHHKFSGHSTTDYKATRAKETLTAADKRRGRPLGAKTKRLRLDSDESQDLKASWEEAHELLRPPPGATPSVVNIDGHQFEEYEEPPVLTKKTVTRTKPSGEKDRWVQCDECSKFRKVPSDVCLHTKWTCVDNIWDPKRASCNAAKELSNDDMEQLMETLAAVREKKQGEPENPSGLHALATAAAFGDAKPGSPPPPAATTKHPRHRPGCTCIVCIQPPSGKGPKHKPTCVCNVCLTVKRRFKTLMMRRKKRQSEREAETARKKKGGVDDPAEVPPATATTAGTSSTTTTTTSGTKWKENGKGGQQQQEQRGLPKIACRPAHIQMTERGKVLPFTAPLLGAGGSFAAVAAAAAAAGSFQLGDVFQSATGTFPSGAAAGTFPSGTAGLFPQGLFQAGGSFQPGSTGVAGDFQPGGGGDPFAAFQPGGMGSSPTAAQAAASAAEKAEAMKGHIDLNSQPERDEVRTSMMKLLQDATLPLDMYLKQQGIASLVSGGASAFASSAPPGLGDLQGIEQQQQPPQQQQHQELQQASG